VVVAGVITAISLTAFGTTIADGIKAAICRITGGSCSVSATASHEPPGECETNSHSVEVTGDVVVFSVDAGGTGKLTLSRGVDKSGKEHWYVQQEGEARLGADVLFGEKANLGDLGEGASAEVKAFLRGGAGEKMEFATEQDARDFMTAAEHEPIKQAATGWDPTGITHWLADKVDGHHYAPPAPTEYFFDGGEKVEGSLDFKGGVGGVGAKAGVSGVVGVKIKPNNDPQHTSNKTVYLKLTAEAAGRFGLLDMVQGEVSDKGEVVVGIEYDGQGRPKTATLDVAGTVKAQLGPGGPVGDSKTLTSIAGFAPKAAPKLANQLGGAKTAKVKFTINLQQGNNLPVVADALHSVGVPVLLHDGSGTTPNPVDGIKSLYQLYDSGAPGTYLSATTYTATSDSQNAGVKGGDVLAFGVEGGFTIADSTVDGGAYYQPGQGFVQWAACGK
jgi:hypothetical protein